MTDLPNRKQIRIENYDYSTPGAYFITVCTHNREKLFWNRVGADINGGWIVKTVGFQTSRQTRLAEILL